MYIYKCFYKGYIISFLFDRSTMSWTENKDTFLMREMTAQGFFQYGLAVEKEEIYGRL